jgi:quaternary ammonium compound-resistance protein SugE
MGNGPIPALIGVFLMNWILLFCAALFEIVWAVSLKWSDGLSRLWPSVLTIVAMLASFVLLALAVKTLPLGTAYAVWTGVGAVGAALFGMLCFGDPVSAARIVFLGLIVTGVVGLKLAAGR